MGYEGRRPIIAARAGNRCGDFCEHALGRGLDALPLACQTRIEWASVPTATVEVT